MIPSSDRLDPLKGFSNLKKTVSIGGEVAFRSRVDLREGKKIFSSLTLLSLKHPPNLTNDMIHNFLDEEKISTDGVELSRCLVSTVPSITKLEDAVGKKMILTTADTRG
ncbi:hypothetical protein ABW19_dt0200894 [Dactylella cylindrospora]|nr:hypothetical protein ABW19_dt0200894 [Dactylella cylindrospora]